MTFTGLPYAPYDDLRGTPHVVVDGAAQEGTVLTLSHWPNGATPDDLLADTSAEIVLRALDQQSRWGAARAVTNNHPDQDGLMGIWAANEDPYAVALPRVLEVLDHTDRFEDLWRPAEAAWDVGNAALADGTVTITEDAALDLAVVTVAALGPALHVESGMSGLEPADVLSRLRDALAAGPPAWDPYTPTRLGAEAEEAP